MGAVNGATRISMGEIRFSWDTPPGMRLTTTLTFRWDCGPISTPLTMLGIDLPNYASRAGVLIIRIFCGSLPTRTGVTQNDGKGEIK